MSGNDKKQVISFEAWKRALLEEQKDQSMKSYLKALSFHDLLNEYQATVAELNEEPYGPELAKRSKHIIEEFQGRIDSSTQNPERNLKVWMNKTDEKIFHLNELL